VKDLRTQFSDDGMGWQQFHDVRHLYDFGRANLILVDAAHYDAAFATWYMQHLHEYAAPEGTIVLIHDMKHPLGIPTTEERVVHEMADSTFIEHFMACDLEQFSNSSYLVGFLQGK